MLFQPLSSPGHRAGCRAPGSRAPSRHFRPGYRPGRCGWRSPHAWLLFCFAEGWRKKQGTVLDAQKVIWSTGCKDRRPENGDQGPCAAAQVASQIQTLEVQQAVQGFCWGKEERKGGRKQPKKVCLTIEVWLGGHCRDVVVWGEGGDSIERGKGEGVGRRVSRGRGGLRKPMIACGGCSCPTNHPLKRLGPLPALWSKPSP